MKTITLEEHFATPTFWAGPGKQLNARGEAQPETVGKVVEQLSDVGARRIAEMDAAGIDIQVLSLTSPGVEQLEPAEALALSRDTNDWLASAIRPYPGRLAGFASLPTQVPDQAAIEFERVVKRLGFKGAMINGHTHGRYLDDPMFRPILECASALKVPIYIHPTHPPKAVIEASYGGFSETVTDAISGPGWGWHIETAVHVIRMILGGVFDRFENLQVVIGHLGEGLPFMIERFDFPLPQVITKLKRPVAAYLRENLHYTFSAFNFTPAFIDLFLEVGVDRIMFSADYPWGSMSAARSFLDKLPVSPLDRERIAHGNAERLLRI